MATMVTVGIIFGIMLMVSPAFSLNCTTQKFSQNRSFLNCTDLPALSSIFHWTYNSSAATLSVAFTAPPASSDGWVSWAINTTDAVMKGAQALVAFKQDGAVVVKPFVLNSYSSIVQTNLSYPVTKTSSEEADGVITIFATFQLPEKMTKFYHIWQVGAAVSSGGVPAKHEFKEENLNAKGTLDLIGGGGGGGGEPAGAPGESPSPGGWPEGPAPSPNKAGDSGIRMSNMAYYLLLSLGSFMVFCL